MPGTGRRPSIDPRNELHPMRRALAEVPPVLPVPDIKVWRFDAQPLNQGNTSTCTAHAGVQFIHAEPFRHRGFIPPFEFYREVVVNDEYDDNDHEATGPIEGMQLGSSGTGVAKALQKRGLIGPYLWGTKLQDVILWVLTRGPVMIGSNWYDSMMNPTEEGFIKILNSSPGGMGHEWLLRGVDTKRGIGHAVNSWGPDWNRKAKGCRPGHFLIDLDTLDRLMREDGDAVSAIELPRTHRAIGDGANPVYPSRAAEGPLGQPRASFRAIGPDRGMEGSDAW